MLYQQHRATRDKARKVLQLQNNIRAFRTIPKQYLPQHNLQLVQPSPSLTGEFHAKYTELFFEHLSQVITSNSITLEMEEARLRQIVSYTEEQLAESAEPSPTIAMNYHHFITSNEIPEHDVHPDLLPHIPHSSKIKPNPTDTTSSSAPQQQQHEQSKKRKRPSPRSAEKRKKLKLGNVKQSPTSNSDKPF